MTSPQECRTFDYYVYDKVVPYMIDQLNSCKRIDIGGGGVYKEGSLKAATRTRRRTGTKRKGMGSGPIPSNWQGFLHDDKSKTELNELLAKEIIS